MRNRQKMLSRIPLVIGTLSVSWMISAGTGRAFAEEKAKCVCTKEYKPVCGADDKTYSNECLAKCAGTTVKHTGKCTADDKPCDCTKEYKPVCGADGKTYSNECLAKCAGTTVKHPGNCGIVP